MAERSRCWWRRWPSSLLVLAVGAVWLVGLGLLWWKAPSLYDAGRTKDTAAATTRAGILVVCAATLAAVLAALALLETQRANRETAQRERYSKAIDQLGTPGVEHVDVRLGGIYALERLAQDSDRDLHTIVEVLCAFVRGHGEGPKDASVEGLKKHRPPADVQAALTVIGRMRDSAGFWWAELQGAHLECAKLNVSDLSNADLMDARLSGADLEGADLIQATLTGADLTRAFLNQTNFEGADLSGAKLTGAILTGANLSPWYLRVIASAKGADLTDADLTDADLAGADLADARGLTQGQLETARGDEDTLLPDGLTRPEHWIQRPPGSDPASAGRDGGSD